MGNYQKPHSEGNIEQGNYTVGEEAEEPIAFLLLFEPRRVLSLCH